ncbi:thiamine-phosphate kinase [Psychrosphaera sp. F3M07]|uniref:Thiamine-monophosphate kinase n=1 Tax=Psychrosphaera aquimarina TaxID=2044854 RepID=A0ABU3QZ97_9GAMM|nr:MULTISPECIES: thiamine-phosphate kinase [Psychrosphaera]MBU2917409.1 thiamine-phosphate kinase [Psychrosphaera sp. F3M07]MDU0112758.1 thiamine-phosphate kinase [Psychrosphaera aquimarina]
MKEFELIRKYFSERGPKRKDVVLGVGDDAALTRVPQDKLLVVATDTMVENTHFFPDASPRSIGHRCLAVNLSDFAAMGAEPAWASVAITLPTSDEKWVEEFSNGLFEVAEYFNVQIIGGDTTQGPLTVTVCLKGFVPENKALIRSGAKSGDWIYVTGSLGDSALTVASKLNKINVKAEHLEQAQRKFNYPVARLAAGQVLRHAATSAIDISDGLIQDLSHILNASNVSAEIDVANLPISQAVLDSLDEDSAIEMALIGGEDYELLFTVPEEQKGYLEQNATAMGVPFTCIGQVRGGDSGICLVKSGQKYPLPNLNGYQHFSSEEN